MQWLLRFVCIGYVVFLTLLLLVTDPFRLIGVHGRLPWILQMAIPMAHAIAFLVLAVLALMPRWPVPRWCVILLLAAYGAVTEIVQGFVPRRTPEWKDWFQDLAGIAVGAILCWAVMAIVGCFAHTKCSRGCLPLHQPDDWESLREVVQTPALRERLPSD